jgi:hypothetical protein
VINCSSNLATPSRWTNLLTELSDSAVPSSHAGVVKAVLPSSWATKEFKAGLGRAPQHKYGSGSDAAVAALPHHALSGGSFATGKPARCCEHLFQRAA